MSDTTYILGDSLLAMNSLLVKDGMAGKVQMIYVDPPYGIKYSSNFQPRIDRRDVKDTDEDLTHEPEQKFEQTVGADLWQKELMEKFHLDVVVASSAIMPVSLQHALKPEEVRRELEVILWRAQALGRSSFAAERNRLTKYQRGFQWDP